MKAIDDHRYHAGDDEVDDDLLGHVIDFGMMTVVAATVICYRREILVTQRCCSDEIVTSVAVAIVSMTHVGFDLVDHHCTS